MTNTMKYKSFLWLIMAILIAGCDKNITEFGFDGSLTGTVKDPSGNIVAGDITSGVLVVHALAEGDQAPIDIRVKGDGTFQNTKLYPVKTKVWLTGPVFPEVPDTMVIDFSGQKQQTLNLTVTPFLSIAKPQISGTATATSVTISYSITGNNGMESDKRELYCSTIPYPTKSTGSGGFYETIKKGLSSDAGEIVVDGLTSGTKYFLRIGASADGANMNYSEQIEFTTP